MSKKNIFWFEFFLSCFLLIIVFYWQSQDPIVIFKSRSLLWQVWLGIQIELVILISYSNSSWNCYSYFVFEFKLKLLFLFRIRIQIEIVILISIRIQIEETTWVQELLKQVSSFCRRKRFTNYFLEFRSLCYLTYPKQNKILLHQRKEHFFNFPMI